MPIGNRPAAPDRQQLEVAYKDALEPSDNRVTRLGLEILWKKLDETLVELNKVEG